MIGSQTRNDDMGNFEPAAKLVANLDMLIKTDVTIFGSVVPVLYPKSLASMVQMLVLPSYKKVRLSI